VHQTSTKRRVSRSSLLDADDSKGASVERARRRVSQHYYDRPEVRRTLATLILHRAARKTLVGSR
jgi:hypothetical protein